MAALKVCRAWQMPEATLRVLFGSFCPVSGAPLLARDGNRYQMTVAAGAGGELRTGLLQPSVVKSSSDNLYSNALNTICNRMYL